MEEAHEHNNGLTKNNGSEGTSVSSSEQLKKPENTVSDDKERGVYTCKRCGWVYPNPRPSAKHRREHKKHCGKIQSVNNWLAPEPHSEIEKKQDGDVYIDTSDDRETSSTLSIEDNGTSEVSSIHKEDHKQTDQDSSELAGDNPTDQVPTTEFVTQETDTEDMQKQEVVDPPGLSTQPVDRQKEVSEHEENVASPATGSNYNEIHENGMRQDATVPNSYENKPTTLSPDEIQPEIEHEQGVQDVHTSEALVSSEGTGKSKQSHDDVSHEETGTLNYDIEKILKEQTSHHLLCPNCGSCITRRVILKKRKRTVVDATEQGKPKKNVHPSVPDISSDNAVQEPDNEPQEAWGCLACFSIFFHKVRDGFDQRAGHVSCLPYLLPDFHWDGEGLEASQGDRQRSSCLPIEFPWRWRRVDNEEHPPPVSEEGDITNVEIIIDPSEPPKTVSLSDYIRWKIHQGACIPLTDSESEGSCLPVLHPTYWGREEPVTEQEQPSVEQDNKKAGLNCLPSLLPTYTWKSYSSTVNITKSENVKPGAVENNTSGSSQGQTSDHIISIKPATEEIQEQQTPEKETASKDEGQEIKRVTKVETTETTEETKSGFNCLPLSLPTYTWKTAYSRESVQSTTQSTESTETIQREIQNEEGKNKAGLNCIPALLPAFSWGQMQSTESMATVQDGEKAGLNCLPAYSWGSLVQSTQSTQPIVQEQHAGQAETSAVAGQAETSTVAQVPISDGKEGATWNCLPGLLPKYSQERPTPSQEENMYITKETRIQAWIKTITNRVTVKPKEPDTDSVNQPETIIEPIGTETTHVAITVNQQREEGEETQVPSNTLVTTQALVDASNLNNNKLMPSIDEGEEEEGGLIDKRKPHSQQTEIQELKDNEVTSQLKQDNQFHQTDQINTENDLTQPLLTPQQKVEEVIPNKEEPRTQRPGMTTVSVNSPDGTVQVTGQDTAQTVDMALALAGVDHLAPAGVHRPENEYVKSIVYGGLEVTLTSLALVSSGAGSGTKTINVLAISLANLITGLIMLFHNIRSLYQSDRASFEECIGQSLWVNGSISIVSFLVFGCIAPLTYGLSFRTSNDRDYKFAATAAVSLVCLILLGFAKAYAKKQKYLRCVLDLILTGFVAAVAGYFVGDYVNRWLEKLGFEEPAAPPPSPPPPPPGFLDMHGFDLGRRGRTFI